MTHEDFDRDDRPEIGSDRGFGLTVGGILVAIGMIRGLYIQVFAASEIILLSVGTVLAFVALIAPNALAPLNAAWMKLGLVLSKIVTPLVMGLIFYTTVTPTGWILRALGKDLLRVRKDPEADSYWIVRDPPGPEPETMKNQF